MKPIEDFLVQRNFVSKDDMAEARGAQGASGEPLIAVLRRKMDIPEDRLAAELSSMSKIPLVKPDEWPAIPACADKLSAAFLRNYVVFPLDVSDAGVILAMADPTDAYALQAVKLATGHRVIKRIAVAKDIDGAIERWLRNGEQDDWSKDSTSVDDSNDIEHLTDLALDTPVVQLVHNLIQDAVHARATDIHVEPFNGKLIIRIRVDGMLREVRSPPAHLARAVISRIKILSGLNIAERRLPQDGRARIQLDGRQLDLRVASMPTIHGEAIAIRLLDNARRALDFTRLGFTVEDQKAIAKNLSASHGMVIVTGPTGSGKTTTLATALASLNQRHRKILTIEDPIEYELEGINQTQTKPDIGLTFAAALRSFLRHDPDVIMVGEMRDRETADIGVHAALTGHLVLTTLHTNSASGAIARLLDMGVDAYLLASSVRSIMGQRLVRLLCPDCKTRVHQAPDLPRAMRETLDRLSEQSARKRDDKSPTKSSAGDEPGLWQAVGCDRCFGTGYADRTVISEILNVDDAMRQLIQPGRSAVEIEKAAMRAGMIPMIEDGLQKCLAGLTTLEEIRRVATET